LEPSSQDIGIQQNAARTRGPEALGHRDHLDIYAGQGQPTDSFLCYNNLVLLDVAGALHFWVSEGAVVPLLVKAEGLAQLL
jgi:hypothetical protein